MKLGILCATANAAISKKLYFEMDKTEPSPAHNWHQEECRTNMYPDKRVTANVQQFTIDLDLPAEQRWIEVGTIMGDQMRNNMNVMMNAWSWIPGAHTVIDFIIDKVGKLSDGIDPDYVAEMSGMATASGFDFSEILMFNILYELSVACTSILAQDKDGNVYHGRNADFGLMGGINKDTLTWALTESMKHDVIDVTFTRDGDDLYKITTFAGYLGALTASKPGAFSLSVNSRMVWGDEWKGIMEWIVGDHTAQLGAPLTRRIFEDCDDYACAKGHLTETKLVSPAYFILANGAAPEGAVITRDRDSVDGIFELNQTTVANGESGSWYLVQTNADPDADVIWDKRRAPAVKCMKELNSVSASDLFDVLSTKPLLNMMTVFTTIMDPKSGTHETHARSCPFPCPPSFW